MAKTVEMLFLKKQILQSTNCHSFFHKGHLKTLLMTWKLADHSLNSAFCLQFAIKLFFNLDRALTTTFHAHITSTLLTYCDLRWHLQLLLNVTPERVCSHMSQKHQSCSSIFKATRNRTCIQNRNGTSIQNLWGQLCFSCIMHSAG